MSAGGQDMPGGKTRDRWKRQQDEIKRLRAALKNIKGWAFVRGHEKEHVEKLQSIAREALKDD